MSADGLLDGAQVDAFVMGAADENGLRFAPLNDTDVTSAQPETACVAPEAVSVRLVGDLASPVPSRSEPI